MAFSNALNGRMDELRFPTLRTADNEGPFSALPNKRDSNSYYPGMNSASSDVRGPLQRRFTTDSSKLNFGRAAFGQQYSSFASQNEQKQIYEDIQIARRKAQEQLALLDEKEKRLQLGNPAQQEIDRFTGGFQRMSLNGPVSEPTTPPDYSEDVFSNRYSRSSRLSMSNMTSPPGLSKRTSAASSKIMSPNGARISTTGLYSTHRQSTKSMPGSRRGSDEEEDYLDQLPINRTNGSINRFSMPVNGTRISQSNTIRRNAAAAAAMNHDVIYDDDALHSTYSALTGGDEEAFPTLSRDGTRVSSHFRYASVSRSQLIHIQLSANFAAAEIAGSTVPEEHDYVYDPRPRPGHASMPHTDSSMYRPVLTGFGSPPDPETTHKKNRHSLGLNYEETTPTTISSRPNVLQTSFSSNDVPTVKNMNVSQAETAFHQHNVSLGRIPLGVMPNRQSREVGKMSISNGSAKPQDTSFIDGFGSGGLQASAAPFGPTYTSDLSPPGLTSPVESYNQHMYQYNMSNYPVNNMISPTPSVAGSNYPSVQASQQYSRQDARNAKRGGQEIGRYENMPLESLIPQLYGMSKDQHGCRYMQRKLEEGNAAHTQIIFTETCPHIIELMTDPFGNYLCQKLFEHCEDDQRMALIETAAPALPAIALNQHGTRALQKMIEFLRTDSQVNIVIQALSSKVVDLVQDLNGNHVIQKCLQILGAERCQFIYSAVGASCVTVGTHRHGCCVLQRCIDHAQGYQRSELVAQITRCAFDLVQDAYGNYVVQYILDLDEVNFTRPLCQSFRGKVVALSKQKFSSNVIEKCLRVSDPESKSELIEELLSGNELERMLRDSFANYVVQTALDYGHNQHKQRMIDVITPVLPAIKQTPHGRRLASKIQSMKIPPSTPMQENAFAGGRPNNRRQIQINGGGFIYGSRGFGQQPSYPAEDYGSGHPSTMHPLGFGAQTGFGGQSGFNTGVGMGNYI